MEKLINFLVEKFKMAGALRIKIKAALGPMYRLYCRIVWKWGGVLYLYHVEMPVTLKCSLRCKKCGFLMPYFEHPCDYDVDALLTYMDRLFECVDSIQLFRILGGEPFVYGQLDKIIAKAVACPKVKSVDVVTNGTIVPNETVMEAMKNPKLTVQISDYGEYSRKKHELKAKCDEVGVKCVLRDSDIKTWVDTGDLSFRGRNKKELRKQMRRCGNICRNFHNGRLYFCPRSSFGTKLGIPDAKSDYVDFTGEFDRDRLRREIYELNQKKFLVACNYCNEGTSECVQIPVAEQLTGAASKL